MEFWQLLIGHLMISRFKHIPLNLSACAPVNDEMKNVNKNADQSISASSISKPIKQFKRI